MKKREERFEELTYSDEENALDRVVDIIATRMKSNKYKVVHVLNYYLSHIKEKSVGGTERSFLFAINKEQDDVIYGKDLINELNKIKKEIWSKTMYEKDLEIYKLTENMFGELKLSRMFVNATYGSEEGEEE